MQQHSIDQLLDQGMEAQSSGDAATAEKCYRAALELDPHDADALHLLGIVHHQAGQREEARQLLSKAVDLVPDEAIFQFNLAEALRAENSFEEAAKHYELARRLDPSMTACHLPLAESLAALGRVAEAGEQLSLAFQFAVSVADLLRIARCADLAGAVDLAVDAATRATQLAPEDVQPWDILAKILMRARRFGPLIAVYRRLILVAPNDVYYAALASALAESGDDEAAKATAELALELYPEGHGAHFILGHCAERKSDMATAATHYAEVLKKDPKHVPSLMKLAIALRASGRPLEALECVQEAQKLVPESAEMFFHLAYSYESLARNDEAIIECRKALDLDSEHVQATNLLGVLLKKKNRSREALELLEPFIRKNPNDRNAHTTLASIYMDRGDLKNAIASFRRSSDPVEPEEGINGNVLLCATYDDTLSPRDLYELHVAWGEQQPKPDAPIPSLKARNHSKIRIGYVSPDLRTHSVAFFICPVLMFHDQTAFEIYCYSNADASDQVTKMFQSLGHQWRNVAGLTDERVFEMVREDEIDILVDLAGHTGGTRLPFFAKRPAPIQISMIGYPCTTGLPAMDYQITDPILHPPGSNEPLASEKLVRLPHIFASYRPPDNVPDVGPLPALMAGYITFGYFNNLAKLRDPVLNAWARIARKLPTAKFVIQTGALDDPAIREVILKRCVDAGIPEQAIDIRGLSSLARFHDDLNAIDIVLDPFPFNGHTTSCQILHMGVPVVTVAGKTRSGRMGAALLHNLGLRHLIAYSPEEYADIAVRLASDLPRLAELRASLRDRMETSPIMNTPLYTKNLEIAFRKLWEEGIRAER